MLKFVKIRSQVELLYYQAKYRSSAKNSQTIIINSDNSFNYKAQKKKLNMYVVLIFKIVTYLSYLIIFSIFYYMFMNMFVVFIVLIKKILFLFQLLLLLFRRKSGSQSTLLIRKAACLILSSTKNFFHNFNQLL